MFTTILFDIDGVMLSEERYFDASALTVYEVLFSSDFLELPTPSAWPQFQLSPSESTIRAVRRQVFANDEVLFAMKSRGVNANWDMVYLQTTFQLACLMKHCLQAGVPESSLLDVCQAGWHGDTLKALGQLAKQVVADFQLNFAAFLNAAKACKNKADLFDMCDAQLHAMLPGAVAFSHGRALWDTLQQLFQTWYLGDDYRSDGHRTTGKRGFLLDEVAIVNPQAFAELLNTLCTAGCTLGIATGRPGVETRVPLESMGWLHYFDPLRISSASDVLAAERLIPSTAPLSKPHPYSYLRSFLGSPNVEEVLRHELPLSSEEVSRTLIVGDSVADFLAAKRMGCHFAAVLTGLEGGAARTQFESLGVEYILENVLALPSIL